MHQFSSTLKNLKFMKGKEKQKPSREEDKTLSYYACKNIVQVFRRMPVEKPETEKKNDR